MIRHIVRTYIHVGLSDFAAMREFLRHVKRDQWARLSCAEKREIMQIALDDHHEGQDLVAEFRL